MEKTGRMPNMIQMGTYSAVLQYLKAVQKAGTDATEPVAEALHEMPVEDVFAKKGKVLPNGRMVYDMYLFQVKKPDREQERMGHLQRSWPRSRATRPSPRWQSRLRGHAVMSTMAGRREPPRHPCVRISRNSCRAPELPAALPSHAGIRTA